MIHQVKMKPNTRGMTASTHRQALHTCALWNEVVKALAQVKLKVMMIYLDELMKANVEYAKLCTSQQKKIKDLKSKIDSS
jgi:hypothetical protein